METVKSTSSRATTREGDEEQEMGEQVEKSLSELWRLLQVRLLAAKTEKAAWEGKGWEKKRVKKGSLFFIFILESWVKACHTALCQFRLTFCVSQSLAQLPAWGHKRRREDEGNILELRMQKIWQNEGEEETWEEGHCFSVCGADVPFGNQ